MIILRCNNPHNLPWTNLLPFILPSKHKLRTDTQPHSYPDTRPPTPPTIDISMMITSQLNQHGPAPNHQPDSRTNNYSCPLQLILPTIILTGTATLLTASYTLYILLSTQRGTLPSHITTTPNSNTREHLLITLHIIPILTLILKPELISGTPLCKHSLTQTLDCDSKNRSLTLLVRRGEAQASKNC